MKDKGLLKQTIALTVLLGAAGLVASEIIRYINPPVGFFPMIAFIGMYGFSLTEIFLANNLSSMVKAYFVDKFIKSYSKKHESAFTIHKQARLEKGKLKSMLLSYHQMPETTAKQKEEKSQYFLEVQSQQDVFNSTLLSHRTLGEKDRNAFLKYNKYSAGLSLVNVTPAPKPHPIKSVLHAKGDVLDGYKMLENMQKGMQGVYSLDSQSLDKPSEFKVNGKVASEIIQNNKKQVKEAKQNKQNIKTSDVKNNKSETKDTSTNDGSDREL